MLSPRNQWRRQRRLPRKRNRRSLSSLSPSAQISTSHKTTSLTSWRTPLVFHPLLPLMMRNSSCSKPLPPPQGAHNPLLRDVWTNWLRELYHIWPPQQSDAPGGPHWWILSSEIPLSQRYSLWTTPREKGQAQLLPWGAHCSKRWAEVREKRSRENEQNGVRIDDLTPQNQLWGKIRSSSPWDGWFTAWPRSHQRPRELILWTD